MNTKNKQYLIQAIGAVAFVVGGIIARENAIEGVEKLESFLDKHRSKDEDD